MAADGPKLKGCSAEEAFTEALGNLRTPNQFRSSLGLTDFRAQGDSILVTVVERYPR